MLEEKHRFWQPERSWICRSIFFLSHWFYARWRHGKESTRPMMLLAGSGDGSITLWALGRWSDLCIPETIGSELNSPRNRF